MFFVNGWFLQEGARINLNPVNGFPEIYDGSERLWMFHGVFNFKDNDFEGAIHDHCGHATATNGHFDGRKMVFTKQYLHRKDKIQYEFTRFGETDVFVGTYKGNHVGKGECRLVLSNAPEGLFDENLFRIGS
jgi:hypothetical protein